MSVTETTIDGRSNCGGVSTMTNGTSKNHNGAKPCDPSNDSSNNNNIYSGLPRMQNRILLGLTVLTVVYVTLVLVFQNSPSILGLAPAGEEFCSNSDPEEVCSRSDLFAFQMSSFLAIIYCGVIGFNCWHITKRVHRVVPSTPEGRLFGYLEEGEQLAAGCFTFQFWDLLISLIIPEHRTAVMIIHHILASCVSWFSITHQVLHYYGIFFLGVTEVSSIFLVFVDLARYFPPTPGSSFDMANGLFFGPLFAVSFIMYRVVLWWKVSIRLWLDCYHVLSKGTAEKLRPGCGSYILYMYLAINVPLGLLQLYWLTFILEEVMKVLS